jgi:adenosylcobinamide-GDP ribazoletransferase
LDGRRFVSDDAQDRDPGWRPALSAWWADLQIAVAFLTRLPIRPGDSSGMAALAGAARCFPAVGFGVGLLGGLAYALAIALDLPPLLAAIIAVAATVAVTGALHEDGLADAVDGFGGGGDRDRKLAIMRDSRIGTYGVIALVLALGARVVALASFDDNADAIAALILGQAASRALIVAVMQRAPLARSDGLAASAGRPTQATMWWALGIGSLIAVVLAGLDGVVAASVGAAVAWAITWLAQRQIGGVTGDVLGAVQQGSEIAMLITLVALD